MSEEELVELDESTDIGENNSEAAGEDFPANDTKNESADTDTGKQTKKRSSAKATMIEVMVMLLVFYVALSGLGNKMKFRKFAPFKIEVTAYVESIDEVVFVGTKAQQKEMGEVGEAKYMTTLVYEAGGQVHESPLYSKSYPSFSVGEEIVVYVDATDLDSVISLK